MKKGRSTTGALAIYITGLLLRARLSTEKGPSLFTVLQRDNSVVQWGLNIQPKDDPQALKLD